MPEQQAEVKTTMIKQYRVRVAGWSNPRTVIEDNGKVAMEISLSHNHCPTCASRVRYVTKQLAARNIPHAWQYPGRSESFVVVATPTDGTPVREYLSRLLNLEIY
jgi:hypothetical protein